MSKKVNLYNLKGEVKGEVTLPEIFDQKPNDQLLAQFVRVYLANNRQGTRDTKDRSEVTGKAKKPYRQKGTGHARHGSLKAPSMKGGGVAHGPKPQNFSLKMSKTMRKSALISAYAKRSDSLVVLEAAKMDDVKTKNLISFIETSKLNGSVLIITAELEKNLILSSRNIPNVIITNSSELNAYDVLKYTSIVIEKSALDMIGNKPSKSKEETK